MSLRFTVLASGSAGNSTLLQADGFGVLLDVGLGPRQLAQRLAASGVSWHDVHAVLLTHTHSDHWNDRTLTHLSRRGIRLYCHAEHLTTLKSCSQAFPALNEGGLIFFYEEDREFYLHSGLRCLPLAIRHDAVATFGFRLSGQADLFGSFQSLAYLADLGCWDAGLARAVAEVDLLALEFNHDVAMECASGRSPRMIARILGDAGHLSNVQAAEMLRETLRLSTPGRLRYLVQLHLSRCCNHPRLAKAAAESVFAEFAHSSEIQTADQDRPSPTLHLGLSSKSEGRRRRRLGSRRRGAIQQDAMLQNWLPGLE